ncbi:MAG TPA: 2-C-methyl-D-erythritol 2,4-cyclodiphosphate synthase [Firmicutes bacterium]|nr:2-C-methyl-D-erythritol 2,4-cyclodiphosphate synthase [Bacillota bacterium]
MIRTGIGYDSHRFSGKKGLVLGGVFIPEAPGLEGHSDADVVIHALIDALLGAAGAGNIGRLFPDDDPRYKGIASSVLLEKTMEVLAPARVIQNIDVIILAEEPRIEPYSAAMQKKLAALCGIMPEQVSVKGKSNEGMGFVGRREGIASFVSVLIRGEEI